MICVAKRRSNAMVKCRLVLTARTTRLNVYLPKSRKSATRQKGESYYQVESVKVILRMHSSAKYIEGLENRLGRMEALLRLSGILSTDNEHDGMDLQTLEKKLVEKKKAARDESGGDSSSRNSSPEQDEDETPAASRAHSVDPAKDKPVSATKTPNTKAKSKSKKDGGGEVEEVEAISEAMCSLVTNDCGETRYVGTLMLSCMRNLHLTHPRFLLWVLDIFAERNRLG